MLEAVPNVSEGRDRAVIEAVEHAFARHSKVLDLHADPDHHRSVYTLVGAPDALTEGLLEGIATAVALIDLRAHSGVHPRVGVADVVPVVPFPDDDMELARATARSLARRIGADLGLPVFHYGEIGEGRRPVFFRRGGLEALQRRVASGELTPDAGPSQIGSRSGAVLVGARLPLIAYNAVLATDDVRVAQEVAMAVRESGGGMAGVQAIGLRLPTSGAVQVSMNIVDIARAPLHDVLERVRMEAASRGVVVAGGELVGLVPESVLAAARAAGVEVPGVDGSRVLERALGSRLGP